MEPKILRRLLIGYSFFLGILLVCGLTRKLLPPVVVLSGVLLGKVVFVCYLAMTLVFLKDLLRRRALSPDEQFKWAAGFLVLHIIYYWLYYNRFVKPELAGGRT